MILLISLGSISSSTVPKTAGCEKQEEEEIPTPDVSCRKDLGHKSAKVLDVFLLFFFYFLSKFVCRVRGTPAQIEHRELFREMSEMNALS